MTLSVVPRRGSFHSFAFCLLHPIEACRASLRCEDRTRSASWWRLVRALSLPESMLLIILYNIIYIGLPVSSTLGGFFFFSTPFCFFHPVFAFSTLLYDLAGLIDPPSLPALSRSWLGGLSNPRSGCLSNPYLSLVNPGQPCTTGSIHAQIGGVYRRCPPGWVVFPTLNNSFSTPVSPTEKAWSTLLEASFTLFCFLGNLVFHRARLLLPRCGKKHYPP